MNWLKVLIFISVVICESQTYKILGVFQIPTGSHYILASKLFREIANRGHDVTFITPYVGKTKIKNLKEIPVVSLQTILNANNTNGIYQMENTTPLEKAKYITDLSYKFTNHLLGSEEVQNLLKSEEKYDAVIIYQYLNDALLGIGHHFKAPVILFSSMPLYVSESFLLSHPAPSSYVPNIMIEYTAHMNFWQRLRTAFYDACIILHYNWIMLPKHRELVYKYIPGKPDLYDFLNNSSLLLINSHVSSYEAIPQVPNAVEIGGFHIEEPKKLPDHLQKFLDGSTNGVIVFSMGSILQSTDLPESKRNAILKTFAKLNENVLWKWEDDKLPGQPKNLKIMKWIPTSDVLAHPNVKAFISHGGLLSTMESMYHAVPMVGIPVFVDQKMNMAIGAANGYAVVVDYRNITEENLSIALKEVLNDPKFKNNMKKRSEIMRDRPLKPVESALYWIEYVIRHQGAHHLRYPGMDLTWYQRYLLDVAAFVTCAVLISVIIIKKILNLILKQTSKNVDKTKKNK
jgi:UDP:flavonoid glycosyltransferase YjiC (YdhE family)